MAAMTSDTTVAASAVHIAVLRRMTDEERPSIWVSRTSWSRC